MDKVNVGGFGGAPTCSRCSQRVYFNEEKRAIGKVWHTRCFTCGKFSLKITVLISRRGEKNPPLAGEYTWHVKGKWMYFSTCMYHSENLDAWQVWHTILLIIVPLPQYVNTADKKYDSQQRKIIAYNATFSEKTNLQKHQHTKRVYYQEDKSVL